MRFKFCVLFLLVSLIAQAEDFPILFQGRFRPFKVASQLWVAQNAHKKWNENELEQLLWRAHFLGKETLEVLPFFYLDPFLRSLLKESQNKKHLSLKELEHKVFFQKQTNHNLLAPLIGYQALLASKELPYTHSLNLGQLDPHLWVKINDGEVIVLEKPQTPLWQFLNLQECIFSFSQQKVSEKKLRSEAQAIEKLLYAFLNFEKQDLFLALPTKKAWVSLKKLKEKNTNFTLYPDLTFERIRSSYLSLEKDLHENQSLNLFLLEQLKTLLNESYQKHIAGKTITQGLHQQYLKTPLISQLAAESFYYSYPLVLSLIGVYSCALLLLFNSKLFKWGVRLFIVALSLHALLLSLRCFILMRPPVSNMLESVIYVPWIVALVACIFHFFYKKRWILIAACLAILSLLCLLEIFSIDQGMENVQAVLNSQYWLIVHVMLIVASYGVFFLAGVLGHLYLIRTVFQKKPMPQLSDVLLKTLYVGTTLLIPGTILGGVWAAQSWGRFWDWDPKESWAFISSGIYLIGIHAYRYKKIKEFGLSIMSIIGLISISFTWYGVNYILGTGLHSYGFGQGGETLYFLYLLLEFALITLFLTLKPNLLPKS